jgi:hypothetical protein
MERLARTLIILAVFAVSGCSVDNPEHIQEIQNFRSELNEMFADSARSPLPADDVKGFEGLDFFPVDLNYRVKANWKVTPGAESFMMPTTTDRIVEYRKYGEASFELNGRELTLAIYQNQELIRDEAYKDYLFLPFKDLTNGIETYGGGRYIDLRVPEGDQLTIDFNQAYNPYCAYSPRWSCPIPPAENHLDAAIRAGVKAFGGH